MQVADVTSAWACLGLWGPRARDILQPLTKSDLSNEGFRYMTARDISLGNVPCLAARVTYVGELGWELYCPAEYGAGLWDLLWAAGSEHGMLACGYRAIDALRVEKGYRVWGADITPEDSPDQAGLGFAVKPDKGVDFLGRDALLRAREGAPERRLACLALADPSAVCLGQEPVRIGGEVAGRVTSGGYGFARRHVDRLRVCARGCRRGRNGCRGRGVRRVGRGPCGGGAAVGSHGRADPLLGRYRSRMTCSACGTDNEAGRKFCAECGSPLALTCAACGASNGPGAKFCGDCGASLVPAAAPIPAPAAERRLVTVLFADLVGFTSHAEARDPEDVRELLSRYFELCRTLIDRYGGTVEKFIGDAVMAVWGAPVAKEDDIERAVRAALDLAASVDALGHEVGAPDLRARAGVLTGEAAVTVGAVGEGMVAGDLVNTASRIQAAAEPGGVLVGETTKRATEAAVVYEDAGARELKGKAEPVQLWRAVRVIGGRGGALRSTGLESPFVGRDRELRVIKELFHASAGESKAHLVSVMAVAGTGKSRLSWEFFKYIDGLADDVRWHRGRCLPYGEGVTYWALAEMVRTRASIAEGEDPEAQAAKLHAAVEESMADPDERRFVEPRLAHLLGLDTAAPTDRENLFSAWRLFYERLADEMPTVMVFEDMEWADASLLDFIEYLVDWSKNHPLFVLVLARPDLAERRLTWGAGKRAFTSLYLEPLSSSDMEQLLAGLVPGLPDELRASIRERAEGVPLYAVETVRMLLDRGLLVSRGSAYEPAGEIGPLDVPETLHALIAARLDGLSADERRLVQDAAVLGKTFALDGACQAERRRSG